MPNAVSTSPDSIPELKRLNVWKTYLQYHVVESSAPYLSSRFVQENFDFYRKYLRGVEDMQPRWKRCVQYTDGSLGEALGQVYVRKTFPPDVEARTQDMVRRIEDSMRAFNSGKVAGQVRLETSLTDTHKKFRITTSAVPPYEPGKPGTGC